MLIVFQTPFADAREFISTDTHRLKKPDWMVVDPYLECAFIHKFGLVGKCQNKNWNNEEIWCKANRAFRFNNADVEQLAKCKHGLLIKSRCLFPNEIREIGKNNYGESILYQNRVTCSLEVGFMQANPQKWIQNPLTSREFSDVIKKCINLNIKMELQGNKTCNDKLYNIRKYLSDVYLYATTEKATVNKTKKWWVNCGASVMVVEYSSSEVRENPKGAKLIKTLEEHNLRIFFGEIKSENKQPIKIWYIETTKKTKSIHKKLIIEGLLHINASQQCLNRILNIYDDLQLTKNTNQYANFQRYLEFAFASLYKRDRFGFPCKEFAEILQECEEAISKDIWSRTLSKLRELGIRGNYLRNLEEYISKAGGSIDLPEQENKIDILILTAVKDEFDVIHNIEPTWEVKRDKYDYDYYVRQVKNKHGNLITLGLARAVDMGSTNTTNLATRLIDELKPSCLAMAGICAGWRDKVTLGDVIVADSVFNYDIGMITKFNDNDIEEEQFFNNIQTYNLYPNWKQKAQDMSQEWKKTIVKERPIEYDLQEIWALDSIDNYSNEKGENPISHKDRKKNCPDWSIILKRLEKNNLIEISEELMLTEEGKKMLNRERYINPDGRSIPAQPNVHVAPIATGRNVVRDINVFPKISKSVRSVRGLEMEASAIGAVAELMKVPQFIVVKAVSDYADQDKSDYFREYAIEVSYRFLMAFIIENYPV